MAVAVSAAVAAIERPAAHASHQLEVGATATNLSVTGFVGASWALGDSLSIGARVRAGGILTGYIAGYAIDEGSEVGGELSLEGVLGRSAGTTMLLSGALGARVLQTGSPTPAGDDASIEVTARFDMGAHIQLTPAVAFRAAIRVPISVAVVPEPDLAVLGNPMVLGLDIRLSERFSLSIEGVVGGLFGFGGDGPKALGSGTVALKYRFGEQPTKADVEPAVPVFVALEWRGLALGNHFSHGPGFQAGVIVADGWLKLGFAGYARPGPMNPATFDLAVPSTLGGNYRGKSTVALKSDGGFIGAVVAPVIHFEELEWLKLEFPILLGQGTYGFYLSGDDRNTPDDRRVSAWENALMDGRDASFGFVVEPGVTVTFAPKDLPWLRPYIGFSYSFNIGYDAFISATYDGPTVSIGSQFGLF